MAARPDDHHVGGEVAGVVDDRAGGATAQDRRPGAGRERSGLDDLSLLRLEVRDQLRLQHGGRGHRDHAVMAESMRLVRRR